MSRLEAFLVSTSHTRVRPASTVQKLEKAIDMRTTGSMSATIAMSGKVDLESNTKGQASRVDVVKLAKAEAKIKVCHLGPR